MNKWTWLAAAALAALVAGCVSLQQQTTLNADGSGRMVVDMWVDNMADLAGTAEGTPGTAATAETAGTAAAAPAPKELAVSEEMGPAFANVEGVKIEENWIKTETEGEGEAAKKRDHTRLVLSFDNIERLKGHGVFEKADLAAKVKGGKFSFSQVIHNEPKDKESESSAESEALAKQMFEGYTFTYSVTMPGEVKETNGTVAEDKRTVTWSWPLYDFSQMKTVEMTATSALK